MDADVALMMWDDVHVYTCVAVLVEEKDLHDLGRCSHLPMDSLYDNGIGDGGARELGAALQVNTTLTELK